MKRFRQFVYILLILGLVSACGTKKEAVVTVNTPTPEPQETATPEMTEEPEKETEETTEEGTVVTDGDVDMDLTFMSGTALYSQVYNMVNYPDEYVGQKIRVRGILSMGINSAQESIYGVIIPDAAGCCAEGMQILPEDENEVLPETGEEIYVEGTFGYVKDPYVNLVQLSGAKVWQEESDT